MPYFIECNAYVFHVFFRRFYRLRENSKRPDISFFTHLGKFAIKSRAFVAVVAGCGKPQDHGFIACLPIYVRQSHLCAYGIRGGLCVRLDA